MGELDDLKNNIIQEHINGFEKGLRQAAFFHREVDVTDVKFDVNKDVVDGRLVNEDDGSAGEEANVMVEEKAAEEVNEAVDLEKWGLTRRNRTLTFIVLNIFEPMSVITGTLCYVGILCVYV